MIKCAANEARLVPKSTNDNQTKRTNNGLNVKANKLLCRYAARGHPNNKGAVLYADATTNVLKSSVDDIATRAP